MTRIRSCRLALLLPVIMGAFVGPSSAQPGELGASIRLRHNTLLNADLDGDVEDSENFTEMRVRLRFQRSFGESALALVELQDSRVLGEAPSTLAALDRIDLHQAYVELQRALSRQLSLKFGRMSMSYGGERQIGTADWNNVARSFDGVRVGYQPGDAAWLHGFALQLAETSGGSPNDAGLFGLYLHWMNSGALSLEGYFLDVYTDNGSFEDPAGTVDAIGSVFTAGARLEFARQESRSWRLYAEAAYQFGATAEESVDDLLIDGSDVAAYAAVAGGRFELQRRLRPWLGLELNLASGDEDPGDAELKTYQQLFPTSHAVLGYADRVGWQNVRALSGSAGVAPNSQWECWTSYHVFALSEAADRWYGSNGIAVGLVGHPDFDSSLGQEFDLSLRYRPETALQFEAHLMVFWPGSWTEQATAYAQNGGDAGAAIDDPVALEPATTFYFLAQADF